MVSYVGWGQRFPNLSCHRHGTAKPVASLKRIGAFYSVRYSTFFSQQIYYLKAVCGNCNIPVCVICWKA